MISFTPSFLFICMLHFTVYNWYYTFTLKIEIHFQSFTLLCNIYKVCMSLFANIPVSWVKCDLHEYRIHWFPSEQSKSISFLDTRSYFLVGDCPDSELGAKPDDPRFDNPTFTMLHRLRVNGMYTEGFKQMISCPGSNVIWSTCDDGVWTPPLDCAGSNIIIHYFKIEKHT